MNDPRTTPHTFTHWKIILVGGAVFALFGAGIIVIAIALGNFDDSPNGVERVYQIILGLWTGAVHGAWISYDANRLGLRLGRWRWAAILLNVPALWMYLLKTRGFRGLQGIVMSLGLYALVWVNMMGLIVCALQILYGPEFWKS